MITCIIMGGLGNQLFQIFAMFGYALKARQSVIFQYKRESANRFTYWETFLSSLKTFTTNNPIYGITNEMLDRIRPIEMMQHHYIEIPVYPSSEITRLTGYFQSHKYFHDYRNTIFRLIRLDPQRQEVCKTYSYYFNASVGPLCVISMHFRYGDYKHLVDYHPLMPYEYYLDSLQYVCDTLSSTHKKRVLYFCEKEDNATINGFISRLTQVFPNIQFIKVDDTIEDWKQMLLMSNCDANIIANSTFSWWGAYFNTSQTNVVCYPSKWFGPNLASHQMNDMFLPEWKEIIVR